MNAHAVSASAGEASPRRRALILNEHARCVVAEILEGVRSHRDLKEAFDWEETPEGHSYWSAQRQRPELSTHARTKLIRALEASRA